MKKRFKEESVIFISVLKWLVLATAVGIIVGLAVTAFLKILNASTLYTNEYSYYYLLLPVALLLSTVIIGYLAPDAEGHGTEKVIEAVHKRSGRIKAMVVPVKLVATVITLALGGSAGKEGPCAQIGAGLSSVFAGILRFSDVDRKKLVICGISGGFASVFGTPIAGAIFGIEVLFVGSIRYDVLLPSFVAGIVSYQVSSWLGIGYFYNPISFVPVFSDAFFIKMIIAGIFFGFCSFLLIETLNLGKKVSSRLALTKPAKAVVGGVALVILTLIFSKKYLGLGLDVMESALQGGDVPYMAFILKGVFTSITLNFGGSGGIVTPIFFVGATAGSVFSKIISVDPAMLSAIGFVSLLAGSANTPIAASIMAVELFGPQVAPYASIACVISFVIAGHRSVYPSQVLSIKKSSSISVEIGAELDKLKPSFQRREK
ncbi:MAG: chloride channel protein, partial [Deltaproteobacteria bacterium]|nr:chloride channel protein [Deltaproteobacteria bacterium]